LGKSLNAGGWKLPDIELQYIEKSGCLINHEEITQEGLV
jgi:hypothetical protein